MHNWRVHFMPVVVCTPVLCASCACIFKANCSEAQSFLECHIRLSKGLVALRLFPLLVLAACVVERVGWKESATAGLEPGDDASQHVSFSSKTHHTPIAERVYCLQTVAPCRHTCCMPSCVASKQHTNMQQCLLELAASSAQCTEQYLRYALEARALRAAAPAAASQATTALGA